MAAINGDDFDNYLLGDGKNDLLDRNSERG